LSKDEWISVLKLATKWLFKDLRQLAINALTGLRMNAIDLIFFAKEYRVYGWLLEGYERVVERLSTPISGCVQTLTTSEAKRIRFKVALKLSSIAIRRMHIKSSAATLKPLSADILDAFAVEFSRLQSDETKYLPHTTIAQDLQAET
jgi:hypothetical protein